MKLFSRVVRALAIVSLLSLASCETMNRDQERLSSMPHNIPQSWEGQAGFPGMMGAQAY